jgi:hypothetical protein
MSQGDLRRKVPGGGNEEAKREPTSSKAAQPSSGDRPWWPSPEDEMKPIQGCDEDHQDEEKLMHMGGIFLLLVFWRSCSIRRTPVDPDLSSFL